MHFILGHDRRKLNSILQDLPSSAPPSISSWGIPRSFHARWDIWSLQWVLDIMRSLPRWACQEDFQMAVSMRYCTSAGSFWQKEAGIPAWAQVKQDLAPYPERLIHYLASDLKTMILLLVALYSDRNWSSSYWRSVCISATSKDKMDYQSSESLTHKASDVNTSHTGGTDGPRLNSVMMLNIYSAYTLILSTKIETQLKLSMK